MAMIVYLRYENIYMSCGTQVCSNMPDQTAHVEVMFMVNTLLYMAPREHQPGSLEYNWKAMLLLATM